MNIPWKRKKIVLCFSEENTLTFPFWHFLSREREIMATLEQPNPPTKEQWDQLCQDVKSNLMQEMGSDTWYLIIVSGTYVHLGRFFCFAFCSTTSPSTHGLSLSTSSKENVPGTTNMRVLTTE